MGDRRSPDRLQVDAHLDDLQSEMEAGARTLDKIQRAVGILEERMRGHLRQASLIGTLLGQIAELRKSVREQRTTVQELRAEMHRLRSSALCSRRSNESVPGRT
jgi:predicted RNase H-like nuclease (RuvC/YqgF family)